MISISGDITARSGTTELRLESSGDRTVVTMNHGRRPSLSQLFRLRRIARALSGQIDPPLTVRIRDKDVATVGKRVRSPWWLRLLGLRHVRPGAAPV